MSKHKILTLQSMTGLFANNTLRKLGLLFTVILGLSQTSIVLLQAQTVDINGTYLERQDVSGGTLYTASDALVYVQQGKESNMGYGYNDYGFYVTSSPNNAEFRGGTVIGHGDNHTVPWGALYDQANGAAIILKNSQNCTITRMYGEYVWDGIRPSSGCNGTMVTISKNWLNGWRDDGVEAENAINDGLGTLRIVNNLMEDGFVFLSTRDSSLSSRSAHRVEVENNRISLGEHPMDDTRFEYPWVGTVPMDVSGQVFKTVSDGSGMTLLFKNNILRLDSAPATKLSNLNLLPSGATIDPASGGNVFVWLGGSPTGLTMETIDGVAVPEAFEIDPNIWTVTDDVSQWNASRTTWLNDVWYNGSPPNPMPTDFGDPYAEITGPNEGETVGGTVSINAGAFDNVAVAGVQFKVNGTNLGSEDTTSPYTASWNTFSSGDGSHQLTTVSRDSSNRTTVSNAVNVTVANNGGGGGVTLEFNPIADTQIRENKTTTNYGTEDYLRVRTKDPNYDVYSVLRFNVTGVTGTVTGVTLRMRSEDTLMDDTTVYEVSDNWSESALTWGNESLTWGPSLGSVTGVSTNVWYDIDLGTSYFSGNGTKSVGLKGTHSRNNQDWSSRESVYAPVLVVEVNGGNSGSPPAQVGNPSPGNGSNSVSVNVIPSWGTASGASEYGVYFGTSSSLDSGDFKGYMTGTSYDPGTLNNGTTYYWRIDAKNTHGETQGTVWSFTTDTLPGATLNFTPTKDAHIMEQLPTNAYGDKAFLRVRSAQNGNSKDMFTFMEFDVSGIVGTVTDVKLSICTEDVGMPDVTAHQVSGTWSDEYTLTWNNSPLSLGSSLGSLNNIQANTFYEVDLGTSYISSNGTYIVALKSTGTANFQDWMSRESTSAPILIVEVNGGQ